MYSSKKDKDGNSYKGGDLEEKVIFQIIEEAKNKGIWTRDIKNKSNLNQTTLNKVIKALEGKKLIKAVTSVSVSFIIFIMKYEMFICNILFSGI